MSNLVSKVNKPDDVTTIDDTNHISPSPDADYLMYKMKTGNAEILSSPKNDVTSPTQNGKMALSYSPNGSQYAYERAKMKALFAKKNLSYPENCDLSPSARTRKRKTAENDVESQSKKRKLTKLDSKPVYYVEGASLSHIADAREIISAKRAGRVGNENQGVNENEADEPDETEMVGDKQKSGNMDIENEYSATDKTVPSSIKVLDQNLNHVSDCIKRDGNSDVYSRNIKSICDSSPLKSKMSAFEISLLKGKQNLERRKSIESAALRSSPRMNSNEQRPNYSETKKIKSRQSLESGFKKTLRKRSVKSSVRGHKRSRTVDSQDPISPSLIENEIVRPVPKRRISRNKDEKEERGDKSSVNTGKDNSLLYRLNGSPKLKNLPSRLSAEMLSGTKDTIQGSAFTSLNKIINTRQISGVPPPLYSATIITEPPSSFDQQSQRPSSLTIYRNESARTTDSNKVERCYAKATETARNRRSDLRLDRVLDDNDLELSGKDRRFKKNKRKSLEETVNMLRKTKVNTKSSDEDHRLSLSPSQMSRRSSRSSTVNNSPFKTEILTPSSSPCSSSSRSLCSSPTSIGRSKKSRNRNFLFGRSDEVLARWHDGLYYLGKILKINEKQEKCLLRYEDDSEYWSLFKDIHRVLKEEEMVCCVCLSDTSEPPNEIVLCEYCLQGYHQQCHSPVVGSGKIIDPDEPWYCRKCVFFIKASGHTNFDEDISWGDELLKMKVTLPYELEMLSWDAQHKNNTQQCFCYCGGPGIWFQKMLQCCRCKQWFHEACLQCMKFPLMYADSFYIFVCALCNHGKEYIKRLDVDWSDLVHIGLFNLAMNDKKKFFDLNEDLMIWLTAHWDQLQANKYNDLTEDERLQEMRKALDTNETRFVKGSEVRKRSTLYGLRVRVPPPRIHITLPFSGEVTDQQMNKLKIKGRRSKVFMPVECKSPVNRVVHGPLNPSPLVKKRLDAVALNQGERKFSPSKQTSKAAKKTKLLPFLEKLIPTTDIHPFKTEAEQAADDEENQWRSRIWNKFLSLYDVYEDKDKSMCDVENSQDEPPILEKVEPVVPINTSNKSPPMPKIGDKKSRKKSVQSDDNNSDKRIRDRAPRRKSTQRIIVPIDPIVVDEKEDFTVKHVKSVEGGNYYCQYDKSGYGKGFLVVGKITNSECETEYMIQWDY